MPSLTANTPSASIPCSARRYTINVSARFGTRLLFAGLLGLFIPFGIGCASTQGKRAKISSSSADVSTSGFASYYGRQYHGRRTASGERYNMHQMTAAHRSLAFGTKVKVTGLENNQSVIVRINDRGPFVRNRIIDVSLAAAQQLGLVRSGVGRVRLEVLSDHLSRLETRP
jgi:rare lipoprotein A